MIRIVQSILSVRLHIENENESKTLEIKREKKAVNIKDGSSPTGIECKKDRSKAGPPKNSKTADNTKPHRSAVLFACAVIFATAALIFILLTIRTAFPALFSLIIYISTAAGLCSIMVGVYIFSRGQIKYMCADNGPSMEEAFRDITKGRLLCVAGISLYLLRSILINFAPIIYQTMQF